jgi:hypothetical protein
MSPITASADIDRPAHDVVITMGCGDTCPIYPGTRYEDWTLANPAGQPSRSSERSATRFADVSSI